MLTYIRNVKKFNVYKFSPTVWSETDYSLKFRQIIIQSKTILWNIIQSRHSLKKSDREQITLLTHYKRATVYKSLSISFLKKERCQWFGHDSSKSLKQFAPKNVRFAQKKYFKYVFDSFPPSHAKRANHSRCSLFSRSF